MGEGLSPVDRALPPNLTAAPDPVPSPAQKHQKPKTKKPKNLKTVRLPAHKRKKINWPELVTLFLTAGLKKTKKQKN